MTAPPSLIPGSMFFHYRVLRQLGVGGMSTVYLVQNTRLNRHEALKVLAPHLSSDDSIRARFRHEAQSVAALDHRNVVTVFDFGTAPGTANEYRGAAISRPARIGAEQDLLWITMQYVNGEDAAALIRANPGGLNPVQAVDIVGQAAQGLDAAHRAGLIHRDVKPANLLVTPGWNGLPGSQRVLVSDFGIARATHATSRRTAAGSVIGTLAYLSPESLQDLDVDYRADIYALGCTLAELLTGTVPYPRATTAAQLAAHLSDPPPRVSERRPGLPAGLDHVIARALAKDRNQRYGSCAELAAAAAAALNPVQQTSVIGPQPGPAHRPGPRPEARTPRGSSRRAIALAAVAALVVAAAAIGLAVYRPWETSTTTQPTTTAPTDPNAIQHFATPTGNIVCRLTASGDFTGALCEIANHSYTLPTSVPQGCDATTYGTRFELTAGTSAAISCNDDPLRAAGIPTLAYGDSVTLAGVTCDSKSAGLTCSDDQGHYFRISIQSYEVR